jgi:SNF2 family DNA or RNA helicase
MFQDYEIDDEEVVKKKVTFAKTISIIGRSETWMNNDYDIEEEEEEDDTIINEKMKRFDLLVDVQKKQYQYDGVKWMVKNELRENGHCKGGFVCDEMGLGKTIMMIGLTVVNYFKKTLIVVPPVLVQQWYNQIYKFTGHKALIYRNQTTTDKELSQAPFVIATYRTIGKKTLLYKYKWCRIIFDEAHHLRNRGTANFRGACALKASIKWIVTGTPVQNSTDDFYNLCHVLGMESSFYRNKENVVKNYILKRTKKEVGIEIPDVIEETIVVNWKSKKEQQISEEIHSGLGFSKLTSSRSNVLGTALKLEGTLPLLIRARQSCVLPNLLKGKLRSKGIDDETYLEGMKNTSKIDAIIDKIVERRDNSNGKIVFCYFRQEIDLINYRLKKLGFNVAYLDGRINEEDKKKILISKYDVLLLQIQTCCEGINLQENYNEIYFVSPHWNPCVEDQAIGRCHRIGQTKTVYVFRFIMSNFEPDPEYMKDTKDVDRTPITLERHISYTQDKKRELSKSILSSS